MPWIASRPAAGHPLSALAWASARYGHGPVETASAESLDLEVFSVSKIAAMLAKATGRDYPLLPAAAGSGHCHTGGSFARDPAECGREGVQLTLIPGGVNAAPRAPN